MDQLRTRATADTAPKIACKAILAANQSRIVWPNSCRFGRKTSDEPGIYVFLTMLPYIGREEYEEVVMRAPNRVRLPQGTALALCLSMLSGSVALAADPIVLTPGFSELIGPSILPRSVGQIFVGNADVADVTLQNDRQIVITAKVNKTAGVITAGATNVIIFDRQNNEMFRADIVVAPGPPPPPPVGRVQIHPKDRQKLHEYYAYNCPPGPAPKPHGPTIRVIDRGEPPSVDDERLCYRVKDDLESAPRFFPNEPLPQGQPGPQGQPVPSAVPSSGDPTPGLRQ